VPIYEAVGTFGSRMISPRIYNTLQNLDSSNSRRAPAGAAEKLHYPARRDALISFTTFLGWKIAGGVESFRSPAQQRADFE